MYKIIGADGKEYGPIRAEQLHQWIAEGRANAQTRARLEGTTEWKTLSEFPEFAGAFPEATPGLTSPAVSLSALNQVGPPAVGLIIVAILNALVSLAQLVSNLIGASFLATQSMGREETWMALFSGTMGVVSSILGLVISGVILYGGLRMKQLENHTLAVAASVLAALPCSPCCLVGLPIGIWALVILLKPEVKSAFH